MVAITPLLNLPLDALAPLVAESQQEGWKMLQRMVDEWSAGADRFEKPGEALYAAWMGEKLVGICGLNIDPYVTDSTIGRVRRLYVAQAARGQGVGQQLVRTIIQLAQSRFRRLYVRTENKEAARLYERLGFVPVVGVPDSTHFLDLGDSSNAFSIR